MNEEIPEELGQVETNVPSNFLKSVCTKHFLCATFYQHSCIFRMSCMKCVQQIFLKENLLEVFLCELIS